jgi:hypothetical protein
MSAWHKHCGPHAGTRPTSSPCPFETLTHAAAQAASSGYGRTGGQTAGAAYGHTGRIIPGGYGPVQSSGSLSTVDAIHLSMHEPIMLVGVQLQKIRSRSELVTCWDLFSCFRFVQMYTNR